MGSEFGKYALQLESLTSNKDSATKRSARTVAYAALSQGEELVPINIRLQDMTNTSVEIQAHIVDFVVLTTTLFQETMETMPCGHKYVAMK